MKLLYKILDKLFGVDVPVCLHYSDIPEKSDLTLMSTSYPQRLSTTLELLPLSFFRDRYANELKFSLPALQLPDQELDRLVMPTITRCICMMHLLPASETHHHSGAGGLLVHSLQCATAMVNLLKLNACREINKGQTHEQIHHNWPRWLLAAFLTGLLHDVGKVYDMEVTSDKGQQWDPHEEPLLNWGYRLGVSRYHVRWRPDRKHNEHTVKSIRLMHAQLLERDSLRYLRAVTGDLIVEAMDDAIDKDIGPLAEFLHEAEAASIAKDAKDRRDLGLSHTRAVQSVFSCVLAAIQKLVGEKGPWKIGNPDCPVVCMTDAVYLRLTKDSLRQIGEMGTSFGSGPIPVDTGGMVKVLVDAGFLLQNQSDEPPSWLWQIPSKEGKKGNDNPFDAVRLAQPALLFPNGIPVVEDRAPPEVWTAPRSDMNKTNRQEKPATKQDKSSEPQKESSAPDPTPRNIPTPSQEQTAPTASTDPADATVPSPTPTPAEPVFFAPSASSYRENKRATQDPDKGQPREEYLTKDMCFRERATAADTQQAKDFMRRLLMTLAAQVQDGKGFLLENGCLEEEMQFSTLPLEDVLRRQKIDLKTADFFIRSIETRPAFEIDLRKHVARIRYVRD